jgi:hypothetical protein
MFMRRLGCFCVLLGFSSVALASDFYVYPKNDQTAEQQQKDESECYVWSKNQTGFDPMAAPTASEPAPQVDTGADGSVIRGAARGAVLGEVIDDDAGKGAAAGALIGGMRKRDRRRNQQAEADQWQQEQQARYAEQRNNYNRAFKGCMEARDYSLN